MRALPARQHFKRLTWWQGQRWWQGSLACRTTPSFCVGEQLGELIKAQVDRRTRSRWSVGTVNMACTSLTALLGRMDEQATQT